MRLGKTSTILILKLNELLAVIDLLHAINWKNGRLAQALAILLVGTALGLLWILNSFEFI